MLPGSKKVLLDSLPIYVNNNSILKLFKEIVTQQSLQVPNSVTGDLLLLRVPINRDEAISRIGSK